MLRVTATLPIMHCAELYLFNGNVGYCEHFYFIVNVFLWHHAGVVSSLAVRILRFLFVAIVLRCRKICWDRTLLIYCSSAGLSFFLRLPSSLLYFLHYQTLSGLTLFHSHLSSPFRGRTNCNGGTAVTAVSTDWFSLAGTKLLTTSTSDRKWHPPHFFARLPHISRSAKKKKKKKKIICHRPAAALENCGWPEIHCGIRKITYYVAEFR